MSLRNVAAQEEHVPVRHRRSESSREKPGEITSWVGQLRANPYHPYNQDVNALICSFGKLLEKLDPQPVDLNLARLYALAHGHHETTNEEDVEMNYDEYKKIYTEEYGNIRRWVYEALVDKILAFKDLFVPDRLASTLSSLSDQEQGELRTYSSWTSQSNPIAPDFSCESGTLEFGYTMDLSETTKVYLFDLINALEAKRIDVECPVQQQQLRYTLEKIKMSLWQDSKRYELNYLDEAYGSRMCERRNPLPEVVPVNQIVQPLLTIVPDIRITQSTFSTSSGKKEWDEYMLKFFSSKLCTMYGFLFQILTALRTVKIEGTLRDHTLPFFYSWPEGPAEKDMVEDFTLERGANRWIASLPSYDPRFVITIDEYTNYHYRWKRDVVTETHCPSETYLHMAYHVFHGSHSF